MATPNVDKLSYRELLELETKIAVAIEKKRQAEKADLKLKMAEMAADSGFNLDELIGTNKGGRKGGKVAPKYRHPQDATRTWTGRGRQPLWLVEELKKGKKLESFAI